MGDLLTKNATTTEKGVVELATDNETTSGLALQASDHRVNPINKDWVWMDGIQWVDSDDANLIQFSGLCIWFGAVYPPGIIQTGYDSSNGHYGNISTDGLLGSQRAITIVTGSLNTAREKRKNFPRFLIKFALPTTTNVRSFIGFHSGIVSSSDPNSFPTGDDSLNAKSGIGLYVTNGGNFRIGYNDGSGATNFTSNLATIDTNVHTLYIEADDDNSRWGYSWDNGSMVYLTSEVPAQSTQLNCFYGVEAATAAVKTFRLFFVKYARRYGINYG
jgi:hypothetical protein